MEFRLGDWVFQVRHKKKSPNIFASGMIIEHNNTNTAIPCVPSFHNSKTPSQIVLLLLNPIRDIESIGKIFAGIKRIRAASENAIVLWIPLGR
jgi:hypothetical protein